MTSINDMKIPEIVGGEGKNPTNKTPQRPLLPDQQQGTQMFDSSNPPRSAGKNKYWMKYRAHLFQIRDSLYMALGSCKITSIPHYQKSLG